MCLAAADAAAGNAAYNMVMLLQRRYSCLGSCKGMHHLCNQLRLKLSDQGTTGPKILRGPPSRSQQRGEGNVLNAAQLQGLQSDAVRMLTIREGCPQQPFRQLGANGLAPGDL